MCVSGVLPSKHSNGISEIVELYMPHSLVKLALTVMVLANQTNQFRGLRRFPTENPMDYGVRRVRSTEYRVDQS
jgi:hypothetical protein